MPILQLSTLWTRFCRLGRLSSPLLALLFNLRSFLKPLLWTTKPSSSLISPANLDALPIELLSEVIQLLDWDDVLRMRQVCRRLNHASHERSVWLNIFLRYSTGPPHLFRLEKPLAMHSSEELERLILRWKAVDKRWSVDDAQPSLNRTFTVKDKTRNCSHLLRGGRWFLAGTAHGEIQYFDLDASTIAPRTLIPLPFYQCVDGGSSPKIQIRTSLDFDHDSPYLAFNIAVCIARFHRRGSDLCSIQVWHVEAEYDDAGHVSGLSAQKLSSFFEEGGVEMCHASLLQENLAYSIRHFRPKTIRQDLVVVKWAECDGETLSYQRRVITSEIVNWISLIPGNRILCDKSRTRLFDLDDIEETTMIPSNVLSSSTKSQCYLDLYSDSISEPFITSNSTRFLFTKTKNVSGLIVYHGLPARMEVRRFLGGTLNASGVQLGYNSALSIVAERLSTIRACWDDQEENQFVSAKDLRIASIDPRGFVDDVSGRIVVTTSYGSAHTVVEF